MATVEELLQNLIDVQTSQAIVQNSADSSISSQIEVLSSQVSSMSSQLENIYGSQGAYTSAQVKENNSAYFSDIVSIKEMFQYQFIFWGIVIAFLFVWVIVKGFFKNVSS